VTAPAAGAEALRSVVESAWSGELDLREPQAGAAVEEVIALLDRGELRVATPEAEGWAVHEWIKMAVLLYFRLRSSRPISAGELEFFDKVPIKHDLEAAGVRVVPPAVARYGSFLGRGVVLMPSFVNIGAWVGEETMVDTWATVGSCAQVGARVHLSGGVGIGGVLEPLQARPVIIEDGAFIGSRCIVVEGAVVGAGAVLGAGVVLTGSTPVIDVRGPEPVETRGAVPARAVVIPGVRQREFPAGTYGTPAALIIGTRTQATDAKVGLNDALREYGVDV
jgi:2,3,4,5-tetrahydropyridine-2-carboxylate N-succinyltransferase